MLAFPLAYYLTRVASPRTRRLVLVLVTVPLFSSLIVRLYSVRLILDDGGILHALLATFGLNVQIGFTELAMAIAFAYVWLPFMILPVYAALERVPGSLIEASRDLGAKGFGTFRTVVLPLAFPGVVAGSIFTFSLTLGDFITPSIVGGDNHQLIGSVVYSNFGIANNAPFAAAFATVPLAIMADLPDRRETPRRIRAPLDGVPGHSLVPARLDAPRRAVPVRAARGHPALRVQPLERADLADQALLDALVQRRLARPGGARRVRALAQGGLRGDGVALVLGTAAAFAVARYRFFGVNSVSFLVVIPIALPGVITGIALQSSFAIAGIPFSLWTIMIGHATFCIVIVFNNVIARLRRMSPSIEDASMDLGANGLQTFRYVLFPELRSALVAGRAAGLRALVGRGHRHDLHGRRQHDDPDLDLDGAAHRRQRLGDQRRRRRRRRAQHRARVLRTAADERTPTRRADRLAGGLMRPCARPAGRSPLVVARLPRDRLRHEQLADRRARPPGPAGPATTLPPAEGALRLLVRQGYAESAWVRAVRAQHRLQGRGALRRQRRRGCGARADSWSFDVASIPGGLAYAVVAGRRGARAQPRSRARARELPRRRSAIPRPGAPARAATASRSCGRRGS